MNTILPIYEPGTEQRMATSLDSRWFRWVSPAIEDGSLPIVPGSLGVTVLSMMKLIGFENLGVVDDTWIAAYSAPFQTREECKGAIEFPIDIFTGRAKLFEVGDEAAIAAIKRKPVLLAEGMLDQDLPAQATTDQFKAQFPDAPVVGLSQAGHFCQEDAPETLVALIQQFIQNAS